MAASPTITVDFHSELTPFPPRILDGNSSTPGQFRVEINSLSLEGIVSKQGDAPYQSGRTETWAKSNCRAGHEVVIGSYWKRSLKAELPKKCRKHGRGCGSTGG